MQLLIMFLLFLLFKVNPLERASKYVIRIRHSYVMSEQTDKQQTVCHNSWSLTVYRYGCLIQSTLKSCVPVLYTTLPNIF